MPAEIDMAPSLVEVIHGVPVADPYRWLEDRAAPETARWIADQNKHFKDHISQLGSLDSLRHRVRQFVDIETTDGIGKVGHRYFYRRRRVGEQQPSIYVLDGPGQSERILVDPSSQGPYAAVSILRISADSNLLAYEVKHGGEHSKAIYLVDVNSGTILPDHLARGLARGFVLRDSNDGFYYCHDFVDGTDSDQKDHVVLFHRLGTSIDTDSSLITLPRTRSSKLVLKSDGEMLGATFCYEADGVPVVDFYAANQRQDNIWRCVCRNVPAPFGPFFCHERLFAHRFQPAHNGEIGELDVVSGQLLRIIVPEWRVKISNCTIIRNRFYVRYLVGTESVVRIWSLDGKYLGTLPLDEGHTWALIPGYTTETDEFFLHCESFTKPPTLLRCNLRTDERFVWSRHHTPVPTAAFASRKMTYPSKDGTSMAISLVGREDAFTLQDSPVIMTAYGGFGLTLTPQFSAFITVLLELGFLFVLPEIRGGGEHGRSWHEAARGRNRQVAFDDFIAAAKWLCEKGFTNPQKLAVFGGSNSGILIGAAITQRPDLFRAALCIAPLLDMIRYHLFDRARIWAGEYGTADDPEDFRALLAYSPYHHIREDTNYPAVLFVCGDKDTRCNPAHARKMAARLGDRSAQNRSILIDHSEERGHAATMPLSVRIDGITHRIAFLCRELGVSIPQEAQDDATGR